MPFCREGEMMWVEETEQRCSSAGFKHRKVRRGEVKTHFQVSQTSPCRIIPGYTAALGTPCLPWTSSWFAFSRMLYSLLPAVPLSLVSSRLFAPIAASCRRLSGRTANSGPAPRRNFRSKCGSVDGGEGQWRREERGTEGGSGRVSNLISRRETRLPPRWNSIRGDRQSARLRAAHLQPDEPTQERAAGWREEGLGGGGAPSQHRDRQVDESLWIPVSALAPQDGADISESAHTGDFKMEIHVWRWSDSLSAELVINSRNTEKPDAV